MLTETRTVTGRRPPYLTIGLLSGTALAYEVLLTRLFSIIQWHHFAYMIISLALLGYGASGTFLSFVQQRLLRRYGVAVMVQVLAFALTMTGSFTLAQALPLNPEELLWSGDERIRLLVVYLVLSLPFFFAANAIGLTLVKYPAAIGGVYAIDLAGAGLGALTIVLSLYAVAPLPALLALSGMGLACAVLAVWELRASRVWWLAAGIAALGMWPATEFTLSASPYKSLNQALRVSGARLIAERHSPLGLVQVVEHRAVPARYAPGMSLRAERGPTEQLSLFVDGNSAGAITRQPADPAELDYLDQLTSALPYHLGHPSRTLIVGAGGGAGVLQARYHATPVIDALELNPQIIELVERRFGDFTAHLYTQPGVRVHIGEARGFVARQPDGYDLIQHGLDNALGASPGGLFALRENYLYTTEALSAYLGRLAPGGYLVFDQWIQLPPRGTLKLFATAVAALERAGVSDPGAQLLLIRGWQTSTLVIKNGVFTAAEIDAARAFCSARAFDLAWYPGIDAAEVNRHNVLREPYFHDAAVALLGEARGSFIERYKFDLTPATDDRPYFHNFFRWSALREILRLRGQGGIPLIEAGYPVVVATLLQGVAAGVALILLPLAFAPALQGTRARHCGRARVTVCFGAIGVAFMFVEIAFMQKFNLFLQHPVYTVALVLAAFLVFAGLGSWLARSAAARGGGRSAALLAVGGILICGAGYVSWLDDLFRYAMVFGTPARVLISLLLIAPLALCMGIPFPLALSAVGRAAPPLVPFAWAVNGCTSVVSAVLATLLAVHFGFDVVVQLALLLYVVAAMAFPAGRTVAVQAA